MYSFFCLASFAWPILKFFWSFASVSNLFPFIMSRIPLHKYSTVCYPFSCVEYRTSDWLLLLSRFSRDRLCATPWTASYQAPLSLGFSRQEHWSGLPCPSPNPNPNFLLFLLSINLMFLFLFNTLGDCLNLSLWMAPRIQISEWLSYLDHCKELCL